MSKVIPLGHFNDMLKQAVPMFDFKNPPVNPADYAIELIKAMKEGNGIGLAANQLGDQYRVFCMQTEPPMVCYNPRITWFSEEEILLEEGCLSYPGVYIMVKRPKSIRARFQDPYGNVITKKFTGLAARVFQHETDHLNGVEYFTRAHRIHQERFKRKWTKTIRTIKKAAARKAI